MEFDDFKEKVKRLNDIVEVVQEKVPLTKDGSRYKGICPFPGHREKNASFKVYQNTRSFSCYGCRKSGDVFTFVMEMEGVGFKQALGILARRVGLSLPEKMHKVGGPSTPPESIRYFDRSGLTNCNDEDKNLSNNSIGDSIHVKDNSNIPGCTLAQYSEKKKLPVDFLKSIGVKDHYHTFYKQNVVRIPYYAVDKKELAIRYRLAIEKSNGEDNRFRWKSGDKPCLYGLWRLNEAHQKHYIILPEGESDTHTLWFHNDPACGLPGAASWQEEWAEYLNGISKIYIPVEPDSGGESVLKWLRNSSIRDRVFLIDLGGYKDISELYLNESEDFVNAWEELKDKAIPWTEQERFEKERNRREAWGRGKAIAQNTDILNYFYENLSQNGVAGEEKITKLLYLAISSRIMDKPISVVLKGPSSAGKSYILEKILKYFPSEAYYVLSSMSERALAYSEENLSHRVLVLYENAGLNSDFTTYLIRSLLSEGQIRYETVESTFKGQKARLIEKEGPTGFITTTTSASLHPENETRLLSLNVTDTAEQTKLIFKEIAKKFDGEKKESIDYAPWKAFQIWIAGGKNTVSIPYAHELASKIPAVAIRLRRDFGMILNLISIHAILHQTNRERDECGNIIASFLDYDVIRELSLDFIGESVNATVSNTIRETVEAVDRICKEKKSASISELSKKLDLCYSSTHGRVKRALSKGYLRDLKEKKDKVSKLVIGEPLPDEQEILPSIEQLDTIEISNMYRKAFDRPKYTEKQTDEIHLSNYRTKMEGIETPFHK